MRYGPKRPTIIGVLVAIIIRMSGDNERMRKQIGEYRSKEFPDRISYVNADEIDCLKDEIDEVERLREERDLYRDALYDVSVLKADHIRTYLLQKRTGENQ